jgi:GNAT superfamily N-acetyltransferase
MQPCKEFVISVSPARTVQLKDGCSYTLRPLHPGDEPLLQEFFLSHTPDTIHQRYGYMISTMTHERARDLVGVDQSRDPAWVISEPLSGGSEVFHAVARYYWDEAENTAECAFVVRESKRRSGMASVLLKNLAQLAAKRGIARLWAHVLAHNNPMLALLKRNGFRMIHQDGTECRLELRLP